MKNTSTENLCEHSFEVAVISHALCIIGNERLNKHYDANKAAVIALYHDFPEIITGDLPTPVKYRNEKLKSEYKKVEHDAATTLIEKLPQDLQPVYSDIMLNESDVELQKIVKAADKISALIKCSEELKFGNNDFSAAKESTEKAIRALNVGEADIFLNEFMPSYSLPLDSLLEQS